MPYIEVELRIHDSFIKELTTDSTDHTDFESPSFLSVFSVSSVVKYFGDVGQHSNGDSSPASQDWQERCRPIDAAGRPAGQRETGRDLLWHIVCQNSKSGSCCSKDGHRPLDPRDGPPMTFQPVAYPTRGWECRVVALSLYVFCCKKASDLKK